MCLYFTSIIRYDFVSLILGRNGRGQIFTESLHASNIVTSMSVLWFPEAKSCLPS